MLNDESFGGRNVHVYDANRPPTEVLGGLVLTRGVTNGQFLLDDRDTYSRR